MRERSPLSSSPRLTFADYINSKSILGLRVLVAQQPSSPLPPSRRACHWITKRVNRFEYEHPLDTRINRDAFKRPTWYPTRTWRIQSPASAFHRTVIYGLTPTYVYFREAERIDLEDYFFLFFFFFFFFFFFQHFANSFVEIKPRLRIPPLFFFKSWSFRILLFVNWRKIARATFFLREIIIVVKINSRSGIYNIVSFRNIFRRRETVRKNGNSFNRPDWILDAF